MTIAVSKEIMYSVSGLGETQKEKRLFDSEREAIEFAIGELIETQIDTGDSVSIGKAVVKIGSEIMPLLAKVSHPKNEVKDHAPAAT